MGETRKVTVELPDELLTSVQTEAGMGVTETIREALEQMRQRQTQNAVRKLHGKIKFGIDHDMPLITRDSGFRHFAEHCGLKLA